MSDPVIAVAPVTGRRLAGSYIALKFRAPAIASGAEPGQFINVAQRAPGRLLRRPFSISDVAGEEVEFVFDTIGTGTAWLAGREPGDTLDVVGPLGKPFSMTEGTAMLIGGGYGAAPIVFHARRLRDAGVSTQIILGARNAARVYEVPTDVSHNIVFTTDDGSAGRRGVVTDAMEGHPARVYACGPMPMLAAVSARAAALGVECEVAVEEFMACGIGVCWTCVVPVRPNGELQHARSCTEGPVFDAKVVAWQ
jgi:dihydroorotate dehydrogenase electron transfer subunit